MKNKSKENKMRKENKEKLGSQSSMLIQYCQQLQ